MPHIAQHTIDFLKKKNLASDFGSRENIFNLMNLGEQLGQFKGSKVQNDAILNQLTSAEKNAGVNINANNFEDIIATNQAADAATLAGLLAPAKQPVEQPAEPTAFEQAGITAEPGSAEATQEILARGQALIPPTEQPIPPPTQPSAQAPTTTQAPAIPAPEDITPVSAEGLLPEIPTGETIATQALETVTGAPTFPLQQEAQEAKKAATRLQAERETESFISNIASRGLFFSGKTTEGVSAIEADKLSDY